MFLRTATCLLGLLLFAGCPALEKKPNKPGAKGKHTTEEPPVPTKDQSGDVTFQSFVGRLRIAVKSRDLPTLASMMTADFGYRWDDAPPGENVFSYWDQQNLWPQLSALMDARWVPYDGYMVVPPQLAAEPAYDGFRAGVQLVNGSWRFAYFVPAPPQQ